MSPRASLRYSTGSGLATLGSQSAQSFVNGPDDTGFYNEPSYPGGSSDRVGAALTNGGAITVASNTTYSYYKNLAFGQIGTPGSPVHNVTFTGCCWENAGYGSPNVIICADGPITFEYCTVRPTGKSDNTVAPLQTDGYQFALLADGTLASPGTWNSFCKTLTVDHCDIWGFSNASRISGADVSSPHLFTNNWFHSARQNTDTLDHTDGPGCPGGGSTSYTTYTGNRIESLGDTNGISYQFSPTTGDTSTWSHLTFRNNLFGGFGNCVCVTSGNIAGYAGGDHITFEDNTFSTGLDCFYSPVYDSSIATGTGSSWRRNRWLVPPGAVWGDTAHTGYYWLPVSTNRNRSTGDDSPYISLTDFTG